MKFSAGIRSLHAIVALALAVLAQNAVFAKQQVVPIPVQQGQNPDTVPTTQLETVPASPPSPVAPPAVVTPTVPSPAPTPLSKQRKKGPVDALKPGDFVWVAQDTYEGPMKIVIVLDIQRIYVFQNDKLIGFSTISSGKKGKETPTGFFRILQKNVDHKSNLYSNAPMPYMQRLTWDGIAIHGGYLPGYPASHGCIRLPLTFAKSLFGVTQMEQEVFVLKDTSTPVIRPEPKPAVEPAVPSVAPTTPSPVPTQVPTNPFPPEPST